MPTFPPHQVTDAFLPPDLHAELLAFALASEAHFAPTMVRKDGEQGYTPGTRQSWACDLGLGPVAERFEAQVEARRESMLAALGIPPFPLKRIELELVAHRNGSFFLPHLDTFTAANRTDQKSDRVVTMVYYFHAAPKRFSGGELALFAFASEESMLLEPADNRLVAFPSFAMHEVKPIATPEGDKFEDARFAVNVWLHRRRAAQPLPE